MKIKIKDKYINPELLAIAKELTVANKSQRRNEKRIADLSYRLRKLTTVDL